MVIIHEFKTPSVAKKNKENQLAVLTLGGPFFQVTQDVFRSRVKQT